MNPHIPLETFLPEPEREVGGNRTGRDVQLIVTNDRHGLNNGVFFIKVGAWAVRFLSASLSLREWDANVTLKYSEQSAMEIVGGRVRFFILPFFHSYHASSLPLPPSLPSKRQRRRRKKKEGGNWKDGKTDY